MKKMCSGAILCLCLGLISQLSAEVKLPTLSPAKDRFTFAMPVKKAPVIDGKIENDVWDQIPQAKYFQVKDLNPADVSKQTSFRVCYDDKYLYLAATMWESNPELITEKAPGQKDWPRDRINFIFSKEYNREGTWKDSPYVFLMFGAGGIYRGFYNVLPDQIEKPLDNTSGEWITAYSKTETRWNIESRIPLKFIGLDPKKDEVFFMNVRRDLGTWPKSESATMWSACVSGKLDAHSFGKLVIMKNAGSKKRPEERINGRVRAGYFSKVFTDLSNRRGEYVRAKQAYGMMPGWVEAEKLVDQLKKELAAALKVTPWSISGDLDDLYMKWKRLLYNFEKSSPATPFQIKTNNAKISAVKLNGAEVKPVNDSYDLSLIAGLNALEITAAAAGADPGLRFELKGSPETAQDFTAAAVGAKDKDFKKADVKNGWLWSGNQKKVVFRQNLIWNRQYGNHAYAFIAPHVKDWGVSPGETMFFIHNVYNPKKTGKCDYQLIVEVPEGFTRVNDFGGQNWRHYVTKNVKEEKITYKGKKYIRYTYRWTLPAKLIRNLKSYAQYISFRHDGYKFAKGEKVDFRFRRIVDGNTTDMVNTIKVEELPPLNGVANQKITFPQYHPFMNAPVSREQYKAVVDDGFKAGLNSYIIGPTYHFNQGKSSEDEWNFKRNTVNRPGMVNHTWALFNVPLHGAGRGSYLIQLIQKYPDLQAVYYKNSGPGLPNWMTGFCYTAAVGKYRKEFKEYLIKEYQYMLTKGNAKSNSFFINDEAYPEGGKKNYMHTFCFCKNCKAGFRAMFKIPESVKLDDEVIVEKYPAEWGKWWRYNQKNRLLQLTHEAIKEVGGKLWYYHNTHDTAAYEQSRGKYDLVSIPIPGQTFPGSLVQPFMDASKQLGEKITGVHQSYGQFHTYWPGEAANPVYAFSSDDNYFHPKEQKQVLVRLAATTHKGAIMESAAYCSAGAFYYMGEATRLIGAFEDLFHDGVRDDKLATSTVFKYPNMLVLKKGDERLVLIFNEDHNKPLSGELKNLKLKPGQKATVWESGKPYGKADSMHITVKPQDVVAVHIK